MQAATFHTADRHTGRAPARTNSAAGSRPQRVRAAAATPGQLEQRLTRSESALLLGAFLTLAASLASFTTL